MRALRIFAIVLFAALLAFGPLTEHTWPEKAFTATLVLLTVLVVLFATARIAFALLVAALVFGAIEIAGALKFTYLTTPVLAPDLEYFVNRDTIGVIARYPSLLGATLAAVILIPLLLIVAFFGERPVAAARPPARRARGDARARHIARRPRCCWSASRRTGRSTTSSTSRCGSRSTIEASSPTSSPRSTIPSSRGRTFPRKIDRTISWKLERPLLAPATKPDVVAILEESTFDPRILKACTISVCKRSDVRRRQATRARTAS